MSVMTMKVPCSIKKFLKQDGYGQAQYGPIYNSKCAIIGFTMKKRDDELREQLSQNIWKATEYFPEVTILLGKKTGVALGDKLILAEGNFTVTQIRYRYNEKGSLSHYEVSGSIE